ncbi:polysaccharide transporter [Novosphingobium sp. FGD1]|uniref:Polysaccharide transporter n=1 Tax=Novosphingobium silvae TaxID=2692619 RepID=A0A7X4GDW3_9SPHN|nr:polysaccharide biosynthesis/export family protein [Novosphingobium silvae]MYL96605.1 polysaccharide transporter [Novosphingobium silvae]
MRAEGVNVNSSTLSRDRDPGPARNKRRSHVLPRAAFGQVAAMFMLVASGTISATPASAGTQVPAQAVAPAAAAAPARYTINTGDQLDVFVWGEERMQRQVLVQPDGTFAFPLAGTIRAAGRNVSDIADEIRERISLNYTSAPPDVTVSVRETEGTRFYVLGKVKQPGSFASGTRPNVLQALSMAGGADEFADIGNAVIMRQTPQGEIVEPVRLKRLLKGGRSLKSGALSNPLPTLSSGDVLIVP